MPFHPMSFCYRFRHLRPFFCSLLHTSPDSLESYTSDDDDEEGGEGDIPSLGFDFEHDDTCSNFCAPKYSEEELQAMVDTLYGEEGAKLSAPGGWGRGKWRPRRDTGDVSP